MVTLTLLCHALVPAVTRCRTQRLAAVSLPVACERTVRYSTTHFMYILDATHKRCVVARWTTAAAGEARPAIVTNGPKCDARCAGMSFDGRALYSVRYRQTEGSPAFAAASWLNRSRPQRNSVWRPSVCFAGFAARPPCAVRPLAHGQGK